MKDSKRLFDGALLSVALAAVLISVMAVIAMATRPDGAVVVLAILALRVLLPPARALAAEITARVGAARYLDGFV